MHIDDISLQNVVERGSQINQIDYRAATFSRKPHKDLVDLMVILNHASAVCMWTPAEKPIALMALVHGNAAGAIPTHLVDAEQIMKCTWPASYPQKA